ncbi:MAG TPA: tripartite tricarboxylate transporter substrate-binding protein [Stellaceae bacterium]|jgi:tripartite-type tricarboxylate transporter receptor subunit TctC|nr:tripartite tricarboxylate transporter substrate-binding protein [Stellaceae bacterium]
MRRVIYALLGLALLAVATPARADTDWPTKPVRFIIGVPAGSQPDLVARIVADKLSKSLGQQFLVDNVAGGGGLIAAGRGAHAAPDGYTYYLGGLSVAATDKWMFKSLPYDPEKDYVPVAMLSDSNAFVLAVHPSFPAHDIPELIALAKKDPGKLSYGFSQIGVVSLIGPWFDKLAGTEMVGIPYKDTGSMLQDTVADRVPLVFSTFDAVQAYLDNGSLRAIGETSPQRVPGHDDVQAIAETLPGYRVQGFTIIFAPAGTPADIIAKLNRAADPIVKDPDYVKRLLSYGTTIHGAGTAESIAAFEKQERDNWANIFTKLNYQAQ